MGITHPFGCGKAPPPRPSRRRFLTAGALGVMLDLPGLLLAGAPPRGTARPGAERSCIFVVQQGGCSHIDTWDMKPDAPAEYRGPLRPVGTPVPGVRVCELLPRLAGLA